jgi:hypothetical protein
VQEQDANLNQLNLQLGVQQMEQEQQIKIIKTISKDYEELRKMYGEKQNERDILGT